jgi:hypothetical protein
MNFSLATHFTGLTRQHKIVWKTEVIKVDRFPYNDKQEIFDRYPNSLSLKYYYSRSRQRRFRSLQSKSIGETGSESRTYSNSKLNDYEGIFVS